MTEQALKLGDCAKVISGYAFKSKDFVDEGVPVLKIANIKHEHVVFDGVQYLPTEFLNIDGKFKVKFGDVMICLTGSHISQPNSVVGRVAMYRHDRLALLNQRAGRIVVNDTERLDKDFLYYFLRQEKIMHDLALNAGGAANQANISPKDVERIELPEIDISSQRAISSTLKSYDDLIENNKRRIELLEESARQLYKEWFVRFRFPGHEHVKIIDGVPEGWEAKKVGELLRKVKRPGKVKKDDYSEFGDFPCIDQSQDFIGGFTDDPEVIVKEPLPLVVFGDHTRVLKFIGFQFACGADGTQLLHPNDDRLSIEYFYFSLVAIDLSNYFYARHFKFLKDQIVLIPSRQLMRSFTDFASSNMKQISKLRDQSRQLANARDLLLTKLMNGEIAV